MVKPMEFIAHTIGYKKPTNSLAIQKSISM